MRMLTCADVLKMQGRSQFLKDFEKEMRVLCSLKHEHVAAAIG
jgi:hypothetical protein